MIPMIPLVTADVVAFWVCAPIAVLCALGLLLDAHAQIDQIVFSAHDSILSRSSSTRAFAKNSVQCLGSGPIWCSNA